MPSEQENSILVVKKNDGRTVFSSTFQDVCFFGEGVKNILPTSWDLSDS